MHCDDWDFMGENTQKVSMLGLGCVGLGPAGVCLETACYWNSDETTGVCHVSPLLRLL